MSDQGLDIVHDPETRRTHNLYYSTTDTGQEWQEVDSQEMFPEMQWLPEATVALLLGFEHHVENVGGNADFQFADASIHRNRQPTSPVNTADDWNYLADPDNRRRFEAYLDQQAVGTAQAAQGDTYEAPVSGMYMYAFDETDNVVLDINWGQATAGDLYHKLDLDYVVVTQDSFRALHDRL